MLIQMVQSINEGRGREEPALLDATAPAAFFPHQELFLLHAPQAWAALSDLLPEGGMFRWWRSSHTGNTCTHCFSEVVRLTWSVVSQVGDMNSCYVM